MDRPVLRDDSVEGDAFPVGSPAVVPHRLQTHRRVPAHARSRTRQEGSQPQSVRGELGECGEAVLWSSGPPQRVQALLETDDRPIFRIASPPDTYGRSYSREYFQYLNAKPPSGARMLVAVVSEGNGPSQVIADLAEELVGQLGVNDPLPSPSSSDALKRRLAGSCGISRASRTCQS